MTKPIAKWIRNLFLFRIIMVSSQTRKPGTILPGTPTLAAQSRMKTWHSFSGTSWECSSALFMPTQYPNQTIIEYEGQEVRIGCFSSDSSQKGTSGIDNSGSPLSWVNTKFLVNIKTPSTQPDVDGDFLSISNVSPFNSGKYKCQTDNGSVKTIYLKVIGKFSQIYHYLSWKEVKISRNFSWSIFRERWRLLWRSTRRK